MPTAVVTSPRARTTFLAYSANDRPPATTSGDSRQLQVFAGTLGSVGPVTAFPRTLCTLVIRPRVLAYPFASTSTVTHNLCSDETRSLPPGDETSHYFDRAAELKRRFPIAPHNSAVYQTVEWDGSVLNTNVATTRCLGALTVTTLKRFKLQRKTSTQSCNESRPPFQIMESLLLKLLN